LASVINGGWWKAKILPYKHAIVIYGTAVAGLSSQIAYGGWQKIHLAILPWLLFSNTGFGMV